MNAWIVAVGSEMLTPFRQDTNSLVITERLNELGFDVRYKAVVADDVALLTDVFKRAVGFVDLLVCTGGLGPTEDDLTRDALARALNIPLDRHPDIVERIRERFARRGLVMRPINERQAMVPRGAEVIDNPRGTAPGLWLERQQTCVLLLPGPPREMLPMLDAVVEERLKGRSAGRCLFRRTIRMTGRSESDIDSIAQPIYGQWSTAAVPIATTILAKLGQIELHLTAAAPSRELGTQALDDAVAQLLPALGPSVYSTDGRGLEEVVGAMLRERGWVLAVAESCTGGLLASRVTDVPGSSEYMDRGVVVYSNRAKTEMLGVPVATIEANGAVSEPVALAMAQAVRAQGHAHVGVGITGIAGPGGATPGKPVGTVVIAVTTPVGEQVRTFGFIGHREMVKFQSTQAALNMLRLLMLDAPSARHD